MGTEAFVGWRGHGKTMLAVARVRELALARGAPLLANVAVVPPEGVPFQQIPFDAEAGLDVEWLGRRLMELRAGGQGAVVLLDEAGVLFGAREWQRFPPALGTLIAQGRKLRVDLVYTSQFIDQVDKTLRELTEVAHKVRAWPAPTVLGRETGRRPLLLVVSSYRPAQVDQREKRLGRRWLLYRREREGWYDTDELVLPAGGGFRAPGRRPRAARRPPSVALDPATW